MEKTSALLEKTSSEKNWYKDFRLQLQLGVYSTLILFVIGSGIFFFTFLSLSGFANFAVSVLSIDPALKDLFLKHLADTQVWLLLSIFGFFLLNILISYFYFRKLLRPNTLFRQHIRHLIDRNYDTRIAIKKGDGFEDLANDLNRLAFVLKQRDHKQ